MAGQSGWDIKSALQLLQGKIDPYLWDQGQELFRRGAVEDFAIQADGTIQVKVSDPRDQRKFFVSISEVNGRIRPICRCPYRLDGFCRHQVVALEYLRAVSEGEVTEDPQAEKPKPKPDATTDEQEIPNVKLDESESVLYQLYDSQIDVAAHRDGSLLRMTLTSLGSGQTKHRVSLRLFTGTGYTELRDANVSRWISRGGKGAHPRDARLVSLLAGDTKMQTRIDSERLGGVLAAVAGSDALVDQRDRKIDVSLEPLRLAAELESAGDSGVALTLRCLPASEDPKRRDDSVRSFSLDEVSIIPSTPPWIQLENGTFHPLIAGAEGPYIERLQEDDLSVLEGEELDRFLEVGIAQLERLCPGAFITEPGLIRDVEGVQAARIELVGDIDRLVGSLEFLYEDEWILAPLSPEARSVERDGRIRRFPPAGQALARAHSELEDMGFERDDDRWVATGSGKLRRILSPRRSPFVAVTLPDELESLDLTEREPTLELEIRTPEGLRLGTAAGEGGEGSGGGDEAFFIAGASGVSWLEASFTLSDGDRQLNVDANELRRASVASRDGLIELPDGTVLNMEHDTVRRLVELAEASSSRPGSRPDVLEISLASVSELLEVAPGRRVQFDEGLRGLVRSLQTSDEIEAPELRKSLDETLREYQKDALRWFGGLGRYGLGGILADEMGLGKTLMTLSHFFGSGELKPPSDELPLLIVCPTSLVFNWLDEAARFFPGLEAVGLHGLSSAKREELIQSPAHMLVTSYALLRRDRDVLSAKVWRGVVLDEGQHIKNPESQTAQAAFGLESRQRWVLTGTPIENHLGELWSLFHFAMPGFLGERPDFQRRWGEPSKRGDTKAVARLRKRVQPFVLRRTKDQVLTELPPRIEQVERVAMSSAQQAVYDRYLAEARSELSGSVGDANKARFKILAALTRLRQVCCHPALVDGGEGGDGPAASSGKFELLMELLDECFEEGHRVLLFSQFTSMLDIIERELESREILYSRLDGATRDREGAVAKFRDNPNVPVFLISLKAGGHGLNLTEADTVILYDPWWNPATEEQAAARAHRMGQELPVHVHKLITRGSVEEKILDLQTSKKELAGAVLGSSEEEIGAALDVDDLKRILAE